MRLLRLAVVLLLFAVPLIAENVTIGGPWSSAASVNNVTGSGTYTVIDLNGPANATGSVSSAHVYWSTFSCPGAFKVKFFRRSGNTLTLTAERGPFDAFANDLSALISPAVAVQEGDLIGIARLTACGNPVSYFGFPTAGYVKYAFDVTGSVDLAAGALDARPLLLSGNGTATEQVRAIIPVVGSTAGGLGASFKTSLQLLSGSAFGTALTGKLIFHPQGVNGSAADPTIAYSVPPGTVVTIPDTGTAFGRTGIGSIDLVAAPNAGVPTVITRVYNDAGAAGTASLTEDLLDRADKRIFFSTCTGYLVTPTDPSRTRFNIGVRTLTSGATVTATLRTTNGVAIRTVTKTYPPNWFEQVDSTAFFGGTAVGANQSIEISVSGGAIVYGSTTDNVTNDPNIQFAYPLFCIA